MSSQQTPTLEHPEQHGDDSRTPVAHGGRTMPAGRALIVILVALITWVFLYAPTLERSSEAGPLGTRRQRPHGQCEDHHQDPGGAFHAQTRSGVEAATGCTRANRRGSASNVPSLARTQVG